MFLFCGLSHCSLVVYYLWWANTFIRKGNSRWSWSKILLCLIGEIVKLLIKCCFSWATRSFNLLPYNVNFWILSCSVCMYIHNIHTFFLPVCVNTQINIHRLQSCLHLCIYEYLTSSVPVTDDHRRGLHWMTRNHSICQRQNVISRPALISFTLLLCDWARPPKPTRVCDSWGSYRQYSPAGLEPW